MQNNIQKLSEPFPFEQVTAHIQAVSGDKAKGLAIFRPHAHAIHDRLDTVIGPFDWSNEISQKDNTQICGLLLYNSERGEWVAKYGDSFTQAAELWGIGKYLRRINSVWVDIEKRDNSGYCVKDGQQSVLKNAYDKAVAEIFGTGAPQDMPDTFEKSEAPTEPEYKYTVRSVKPSGKGSQLLEIVSRNGEVMAAYIKTGTQPIAVGSRLCDVDIQQKTGTYGNYNLINACRMAA